MLKLIHLTCHVYTHYLVNTPGEVDSFNIHHSALFVAATYQV